MNPEYITVAALAGKNLVVPDDVWTEYTTTEAVEPERRGFKTPSFR